MPLNKQDALAALPPEWPHDMLPEIQRRLAATGQKVVVLDDDPTGTQSVHGISVLTEWSVESLWAELSNDLSAFYVLTNTRAMTVEKARAVMAEIGRNLVAASSALWPLGGPLTPNLPQAARPRGRRSASPSRRGGWIVISRSDSTLRGHFPGEVDALAQSLHPSSFTLPSPPYLLTPAFFAGGRYTINDVHYVAYGHDLVPVGETEFARDAAFGYCASNLREWVDEKTSGAIRAADVMSISIDDIRIGGPGRVADVLAAVPIGGACIVNAAAERDLEVVALACLMAEAQGQRFLYRSAASFARARAGIAQKPLLTPKQLAGRGVETRRIASLQRGGLIVVGSYVPKTSGQLQALLDRGVNAIEVNVEALLDDARRDDEIARCTAQADALIGAGKDAVVYTSRKLITGNDAAGSLAIGNHVSAALIAIVREIKSQPRYVLAKGGITSSDVATKGLNVKRALVLGQLLPGVPVWQLGPESRYPNSTYIVFPGNVGGSEALAEAHQLLSSD